MTALANMTGVSVAYLSQVKTGFREIGSKLARKLEASFGLPTGVMDIPYEWSGFTPVRRKEIDITPAEDVSYSEPTAASEPNPSMWESVRKDTFTKVELFVGDREAMGYFTGIAAPIRSMEMSTRFLQSLTNAADLTSIRLLFGDSNAMSPTINTADMLLIDVSVKRVVTDGVYLFRQGSAVHLKRLQIVGDKIAVKSDNSKYDTWYLSAAEMETVIVYGRICASIPLSRIGRLTDSEYGPF